MASSTENNPFDTEFDELVAHYLAEWKVLGLSMSVVHGPDTYSKVGIGYRMVLPLQCSKYL